MALSNILRPQWPFPVSTIPGFVLPTLTKSSWFYIVVGTVANFGPILYHHHIRHYRVEEPEYRDLETGIVTELPGGRLRRVDY
ncbi:MAG: hypothetical protein MMC33_010226 [Icmadophila ericetorum]|nr:hypothetical protein [Icmadophila ericetorum]